MRILLLGGYGGFGGRLARLLSEEKGITLHIAGRSREKAEAFTADLQGPAKAEPVCLDRAEIEPYLVDQTVDLVVDASGPFQQYGAIGYGVVEACLKTQTHYLDLADDAAFVEDIAQFDARAREAGLIVLSGASTCPALTAAVVSELAQDMTITSIEGGIAPSPKITLGLNVMRAVLSYTGGPVKRLQDGRQGNHTGLTESRRVVVAPPGGLPLHHSRFSLVDVPDLRVFPNTIPSLQSIWFGVATAPEPLQRLLNGLAYVRKTFGLPSMFPFARMFQRAQSVFRIGEHRSGMFVRVRGLKEGRAHERSWHLLAEGDAGPTIPSITVQLLIVRMLRGEAIPAGARSAQGLLTLSDYDRAFSQHAIRYGFREPSEEIGTVFQRVLGAAFASLPEPVQSLHRGSAGRHRFLGRASVQRGSGLIAKLIANVIGFPAATDDVPVRVTIDRTEEEETWTRDFGGKTFRSHLRLGNAQNDHHVVERFGLIRVGIALIVRENTLHFIPRRWNFLGVPLPHFLIPDGPCVESVIDGKFHFSICIQAPWIGPIVTYEGSLLPETVPAAP